MKILFLLTFLNIYAFTAVFTQNNDILNAKETNAPIIEATYLPVNGTSFKFVVQSNAGVLPIPEFGNNIVWDYSSYFPQNCDTGIFETNYPITYFPYNLPYPSATNAAYQYSPNTAFAGTDGWSFFEIDTTGLYLMGYRPENMWVLDTKIDTFMYYTKRQLVVPTEFHIDSDIYDTASCYFFAQAMGYNAKITCTWRNRHQSVGYGTLITPVGSFSNVLLVKTEMVRSDSMYGNVFGNYVLITTNQEPHTPTYKFYRNNTFASNFLMQITSYNYSETMTSNGFYVLPVNFGAISGTVRDSLGNPVSAGKMLLYREHSNFRTNDILATTAISTDGTYQFDSIPYGVYRIAARADASIYNNTLTTFYGNSDDWIVCDTVVTVTDTVGIDIDLLYYPPIVGNNTISGQIIYDLMYSSELFGGKAVGSGRPVKDVDVTVRRRTTKNLESIAQIQTDEDGSFIINGLSPGHYEVIVGIPGIHMFNKHEFIVQNMETISDINYVVSLDSIYAIGDIVSTIFFENNLNDSFLLFPNPTNEGFTVKANNDLKIVTLRVIDAYGRTITEVNNNNANQSIFVNTSNIPSGLYFVECSTQFNKTVKKIIIGF